MTDVLLVCILFLVSIDTAAVLYVLKRHAEKETKKQSERAVETAMFKTNSPVIETEAEREARERRGSFDEGFENLMRYSVNGKTGFESDGR